MKLNYFILPFIFIACQESRPNVRDNPVVVIQIPTTPVYNKPVEDEKVKDTSLPKGTCSVTLCNKIERFTLSPWSAMKDSFGKVCFSAILPINQSKIGNVLDSESRWYQGNSINPTKKSVTRVESVNGCNQND